MTDSTPTPPGRRRYSEQALLDAALEVFGERGYRAAQMSEIAARAHTSKQTLYARLQSKEELYRRVLEREADRLKRILRREYARAAQQPLHELIQISVRALFDFAEQNRAGFEMLFRSDPSGPGSMEVYQQGLDDLIGYVSELTSATVARNGAWTPGRSSDLLAAAAVGVSLQVCRQAVAGGYQLSDAEALATAFTDAAFRGIDLDVIARVNAA